MTTDTDVHFDIIIVNYNSTDYLLRCLGSIYYSLEGLQAKIHVQDNGSADNVDRVLESFPAVRLSKNRVNLGFARAVNRALKFSFAPYVVILNPDTLVKARFFKIVLDYLEDNLEVGIVGPKVLNSNGSLQGSARAFPSPLTGLFGRNTLISRLFPQNPLTRRNVLAWNSDGITPMEVDWVSGACLVARRRALQVVGLMDERFFMYWEDADWCKRMWDSGWKVVYLPEASIVHHVGGSSDRLSIRPVVQFHKSAYWLFQKHAEPAFRLLGPLVILALGLRTLARIFHELLSRDREDGRATGQPQGVGPEAYLNGTSQGATPEDARNHGRSR